MIRNILITGAGGYMYVDLQFIIANADFSQWRIPRNRVCNSKGRPHQGRENLRSRPQQRTSQECINLRVRGVAA